MGSNCSPQLRRVSRSAPIEDILRAVEQDGGLIIENFLSPQQVIDLNADIDPQIAAITCGSTREDVYTQDFHGLQTKRLTNLVTYSKVFREEILNDEKTHQIAAAIYKHVDSSYWMSTAQVIEIGPGNKAQPLHRDNENVSMMVDLGPKAPETSANFLIALTDFTEDNGATRVIPGSHKWPDFADRGTDEQTIPALMKSGDCLFIGGKVIHGGGRNQTANDKRRAVAYTFIPSCFTPEEAFPFFVDKKLIETMTPRAQAMVGFRSQYPKGSPGLWQKDYQNISTHLGLPDYDARVGI